MKSKLFFRKNNFITLCVFVVFLAITAGGFKLFQYMTCEVKYCILDQLDHNNEVLIKFPPVEKLQFVITGKNLSSINRINFEIISNNRKIKLISRSFEKVGDKIILKPIMLSPSCYISGSSISNKNDILPVSLFKINDFRYILKLSYKTTNNSTIKGSLFMIGKIKLYNYNSSFTPLDKTSNGKPHFKDKDTDKTDRKVTPARVTREQKYIFSIKNGS